MKNYQYRPDIDGLRAIAVIAVILYHINNSWIPGGFIGVDVFFVISGYLITKHIYMEMIRGDFSFKRFYQRRINRIMPVFFTVCFITVGLSWYFLLPNEFLLFLKSLRSTVYFGQNVFFAKNTGGYWDQDANTFPLLHTWSLAVEEQFYFIVPVLLLALFKLGVRWKGLISILIAIAIASFSLAQFSGESAWLTKHNYYGLLTGRAGELLIGSVAGILSCQYKHSYSMLTTNMLTLFGVFGIALSYSLISKDILFPSYWAVVPTVSAALIIYFGPQSQANRKPMVSLILQLKPFVFIGKISYSLYLWHWPVILFVKKYDFTDQLNYVQVSLIIVLTFILSILTYYWIETPFRQRKRTFSASLVLFYIVPILLIGGIYTLNKGTRIFKPSQEKERLFEFQKTLMIDQDICFGKIQGDCLIGEKSKQPTILFIGDSHAAHYVPYINAAGKYYGFSAKSITAASCPFIGGSWEMKNADAKDSDHMRYCMATMPKVREDIKKFKIIVFGGRWDAMDSGYQTMGFSLRKNLPSFIDELRSEGKTIVFLSQVPFLQESYYSAWMNEFLSHRLQKYEIKPLFTGQEIPTNLYVKETAQKHGALFYEPLAQLTDAAKKSWPIYNGLMAYSDKYHLNEYVTIQWSKEVLPQQSEFWTNIQRQNYKH